MTDEQIAKMNAQQDEIDALLAENDKLVKQLVQTAQMEGQK